MTPAWNIPFAVLCLAAVWVRVRPADTALAIAEPLLAFFGVGGVPVRLAASDALGIGGAAGLLFVAWSDELAVAADTWLAIDALAIAFAGGLLGAWLLARFAADGDHDESPPHM
ncbi:MAG TPA: hypothetical protein VMZ28_23190 [Kofleriaceae bacterium]|nr:hypothetical protein [Kofleriaceae bacterium]